MIVEDDFLSELNDYEHRISESEKQRNEERRLKEEERRLKEEAVKLLLKMGVSQYEIAPSLGLPLEYFDRL